MNYRKTILNRKDFQGWSSQNDSSDDKYKQCKNLLSDFKFVFV